MWGDGHHTRAQTAPGRPGCTNVSPAAPRAAEKSELPPHTNPEKLEQKSEFSAHPRVARIRAEIRIAGLLLARLRGWNNFDQPFLKVSSRIPDENTVPSPFSFNSWVGSVGRVVKCKSLNTCQNNKMTNDKFKLVKTPPHGQKPSEVFV